MGEKRIFRTFLVLFWLAVTGVTAAVSAYAENPITSFPSVSESKAYKLFKSKPQTDFARLLYLIDRFEDSGIQIVYDGVYYDGKFAAKISRWFFARKYRKETAEKWIMQWCNTSISGKLIYVKFPDGKFRLSRDVLFDELKALNKALAADAQAKRSEAALEKKAQNNDLGLIQVAGKVITDPATAVPPPANIDPPQR